MKIQKCALSVLFLTILATSCRKTDFLEDTTAATPNIAAAVLTDSLSTIATSDSSGWKSSSDWKVATQENFSVYYFTIADKAITADVVSNGLMLVFKRGESNTVGLPVDEKTTTGSQYWYHQVSEGALLISADTYGNAKAPDASKSIRYFVATAEKLAALEKAGYPAGRLMTLSFEEASQLF